MSERFAVLCPGQGSQHPAMFDLLGEQVLDTRLGLHDGELGVHDLVLLTNSHHTLVALDGYGLSIVGERSIPCSGDE